MQENGSKKKKEWKFNRELGESSEETVKEVEENVIGQKLLRIKYELIAMNYKGESTERNKTYSTVSWKLTNNCLKVRRFINFLTHTCIYIYIKFAKR